MDERSDIFGLGAVLYEIVCGQVPYGYSHNPDAVLEKARHGQVIAIDRFAERYGIPKRLRDIVNKATAPLPADRYQRVVDLQQDVRVFLRGGLYLPHKTFAPGSLIIREGDSGDSAYMIVSGQCRAFRNVGDAQGSASGQETLGTMGAGDVFGEMALILNESRAASVDPCGEHRESQRREKNRIRHDRSISTRSDIGGSESQGGKDPDSQRQPEDAWSHASIDWPQVGV
jgi:eukaryotic-like serine/threonine-protein kinase